MNCPVCEERPNIGEPSQARWQGPDGAIYCSLHFIQKFGHGEKLVRIEEARGGTYEPPTEIKPPAPKEDAA